MTTARRGTAMAGTCMVLAVAALGPTGALPALGQDPPPPSTVELRVGDTVRVEGGTVGCRVVRRGGETVMDCRRAGRLRGSYGTLLSRTRAMVARFRSPEVADVVFTARHRGRARRCTARPAQRVRIVTAAAARSGPR